MNTKFMNIKKVTIPVLTAILIASQLTACGASTTKQANSMIASSVVNSEQDITLEIAVPKSIEQGTRTNLMWQEVGSLTTQPELRKAFDKLFEVTGDTGSKTGWVYDSQNITLRDAIDSISYKLFTTPEALKSIADTVNKNYVDLENATDRTKAVMAINGYFNILPDNEIGYANPNQTMTRKEVMAALFRASNKVTTNRKLDEDFNKLVGDTEYNLYAQEYKGDTYLNTSENKNTYNSTMSRGEAICLLMNRFYAEELDTYKADNVKLEDAKDKGEETGRTRIEELSEMLNNPVAGVEYSMYKAIALAYEKGILDTAKTRWNEGITKGELLELIIKVEAEFNKAGVVKNGYKEEEVAETEETEAGGDMGGLEADEKENEADPYARYKKQMNEDMVEVEKGLSETADNINIEELDTTMVAVKAANVRMGAGTKYDAPTIIERDAEVKVTGKTSNGWYRINLPEYSLESVFVPVKALKGKKEPAKVAEKPADKKAVAEKKDKKQDKKQDKKPAETVKKTDKKAEPAKKPEQKQDNKNVEPIKKVEPAKKAEKKQDSKKSEQKQDKKDSNVDFYLTGPNGEKIPVVHDGSGFNTDLSDPE